MNIQSTTIQQSKHWQQSTEFLCFKNIVLLPYINWRATGTRKKNKCTKTNLNTHTKKHFNKPTKHQMNANVHFSTKKHTKLATTTANSYTFSIGNLGTSRKPNNTAHFHNRHLNKNYYCSANVWRKRETKKKKHQTKQKHKHTLFRLLFRLDSHTNPLYALIHMPSSSLYIIINCNYY